MKIRFGNESAVRILQQARGKNKSGQAPERAARYPDRNHADHSLFGAAGPFLFAFRSAVLLRFLPFIGKKNGDEKHKNKGHQTKIGDRAVVLPGDTDKGKPGTY